MKTTRKRRIVAFIFTVVSVFAFTALSLSVAAMTLENNPCIWAEKVIIDNNEEVRVPIKIANNPGIVALMIKVNYDGEMLELTGVENGTVFNKSSAVFSRDLSTDPYGLLWEDGLSASNNTNNGILATLVFRVRAGSPVSRSEVKITVDEDSTLDTDLNSVHFETSAGVVSECILWAKNGAVINHQNRIIFGLTSAINDLYDYVYTNEDISFASYPENLKVWGTGSVLRLLKDEELLEEYTIILFGDVNGDGWYDGRDAVTVSMIANGMLSREQVGEAVWMAADCNHDGKIDQADVDLLNQAGLLLSSVDQTKSTEELLETSSEYNEYLNLIDQSVEFKSDEPEQESPETQKPSLLEFLLTTIWNYIKLILSLFK